MLLRLAPSSAVERVEPTTIAASLASSLIPGIVTRNRTCCDIPVEYCGNLNFKVSTATALGASTASASSEASGRLVVTIQRIIAFTKSPLDGISTLWDCGF